MICVDSSALIAVASGEAAGLACAEVLEREDQLIISAGTLAEVLFVARRRDLSDILEDVLRASELTVLQVDEAAARRVADAYVRWGKGFHPASLNYGDCFAYEAAQRYDCSLLFVGQDFSQTDIKSAL